MRTGRAAYWTPRVQIDDTAAMTVIAQALPSTITSHLPPYVVCSTVASVRVMGVVPVAVVMVSLMTVTPVIEGSRSISTRLAPSGSGAEP